MGHRGTPERDLEDWLWNNRHNHEFSLFGCPSLWKRQVPVKHGVIDLLVVSHGEVYVIELKADIIKDKDLQQVTRYCCDIGRMLRAYFTRSGRMEVNNVKSYYDLLCMARHGFRDSFVRAFYGIHPENTIHPMLIGRNIDENTLAACEFSGIEVLLWDHDPEVEYVLEQAELDDENLYFYDRVPEQPEWISDISRAIDDESFCDYAIGSWPMLIAQERFDLPEPDNTPPSRCLYSGGMIIDFEPHRFEIPPIPEFLHDAKI